MGRASPSMAVGIALASAGCSLLLSDGYTSGERVIVVLPDGGSGTSGGGTSEAGSGSDAAPALSDYGRVVLADRPVAYYPLDETSGPVAHDASGNAHDALAVDPAGATFGAAGAGPRTGSAVRLRTKEGIAIGNLFDFPGRVPCSFEAWVSPDPGVASVWRRIFDKVTVDGTGPIDGTYFYFNTEAPKVQIERWVARANRQTAGVTRGLPLGRFSHVVATVDVVDVILYVDGVEVARGLSRDPVPATSVPATWGTDFFGVFDELAIYDKVLPADRVRAHYDAR